MTLDVTLDTSERCFDLPEWPELLARDPNRQVFAFPEWNRAWWAEFKTGKELFLLAMRRGEDLVGIVPLYRKLDGERRLLRFVGGIDLTDYLGPICSLEDRDDVAEALVAWLATNEIEWDELDAHNMPVPLGFAEFLVERADAHGFSYTLDEEETSAVLTLPTSWEEYLAGLGSKDRHELRRKMRRFERDHPDAAIRSTAADTLDLDLKTFVEMHRGASGEKGSFMRPEVAAFFERMAHVGLEEGWLRMDSLEVGDRAIAMTFGFQIERKFYLYNSAYETDLARLSPGLVLTAKLVERSIEEGLELFDFLRGSERYKSQLGATAVPLNNVRVFNHGSEDRTTA
jgi:CelD/BcsL family acetyltransferase involved in cellulose biosynthesis